MNDLDHRDQLEQADDERADEFAGRETRDEELLDTSDTSLPDDVDDVDENMFPSAD